MAMTLSPDFVFASASQHRHYGYMHPPPSPPLEYPRYSLPPISNLLGLAHVGSPTTSDCSMSTNPIQSSDSSPRSPPYASFIPREYMPPSPPISNDTFDSSSPSIKSIGQMSTMSPSATTAAFYYESSPPDDPILTRNQSITIPRYISYDQSPQEQHNQHYQHYQHLPQQQQQQQQHQQQQQQQPVFSDASFLAQPNLGPLYSQNQLGIYYPRPLPQTQPYVPPTPVCIPANPWQHHHYMSPSASAASFPQSQDRYVCQTCNKAFSRPSSLRIHSHSHTGKKPFKCTHPGCGKAFSVRSNMKRHERGCHNCYDSGSVI